MIEILTIYVFIGVLLVFIGPAKRSILKAINELKPVSPPPLLTTQKEIPLYKIYLFGFLITIGFVVFWPFMLPGVLKENRPAQIEKDENQEEDQNNVPHGIKFSHMGGHGILSCKNCFFRKEITSFIHGRSTHGARSSSSGFQCQSCGKLTTRSRTEPFEDIYIGDDQDLLSFTPEQRAHHIEHMQYMIALCEKSMGETPKNKWLPTWEPTAREYRKKLSFISETELEAIKKKRQKFEKKYEKSLICSCGGVLERDEILFCPECKSTNLDYFMEYIT